MVLNAKSIDSLVLVDPRRIRQKQVKSLLRSLELGLHFETNLVMNRLNKILRIIDGCHRIEAMKAFFKHNPKEEIEIYAQIYTDLTRNEERDIFYRTNISIRQSTHDFIHSYRDTLPVYKELTTKLPVTIYGSKNRLRLKNVCEAYLSSKTKLFQGGLSCTKLQFVEKIQTLDDNDVHEIKDTFEMMQTIFNKEKFTDIANMTVFKTTPYIALTALIQRNKSNLGKDFIIKQMKRSLNKHETLSESNRGGQKACIQAYAVYKAILNSLIPDESKHFI